MSSCCCCFSEELSNLRRVATQLLDIMSRHAPDNNLSPAKQRDVIGRLLTVLEGLQDWKTEGIDFQAVSISDLTIQLGRWTKEQERFDLVIQLAENRLRGATYKMPVLCNDLKTVTNDMARVIRKAIARITTLQ